MAENTLAGMIFFGAGILITALIITVMNLKKNTRNSNHTETVRK